VNKPETHLLIMSDYICKTILLKEAYHEMRKVCNRDGMFKSRAARDA